MPKRLSSPGGADALVCARPPGRALRSFVAHALMRAASTLVSTLGCISHWLWHAALYYTPLNSSPPAKISPRPPLPPQAGASAATSSLPVLVLVLCLSPLLRASALKSFLRSFACPTQEAADGHSRPVSSRTARRQHRPPHVQAEPRPLRSARRPGGLAPARCSGRAGSRRRHGRRGLHRARQ